MQEQIRTKAKELLQAGDVDCFIGYERATDGKTSRPAFAYSPDDAERLVLDGTCAHNLTKYLLNRKGKKTAVVVKPCDSRSVNLLINENQLVRDKVYIVGVTCNGMKDVAWDRIGEGLQERCRQCRNHTPVVYDYLIGEPVPDQPGGYEDVEEMEAMDAVGRRAFWQEQFSRCIRCHACRQICPGCYCSECFVDQLDPTWVGIRRNTSDNEVWNTIRAFHLAGRCSSCNECERACPVNIPLSLLNRKLEKEIGEMFDYQAGQESDAVPPFAAFKKDEHLKGAE